MRENKQAHCSANYLNLSLQIKSNQIKHFDLVTQLLGVNSIKVLYISHMPGSFLTLVSHLSQMTLPESL